MKIEIQRVGMEEAEPAEVMLLTTGFIPAPEERLSPEVLEKQLKFWQGIQLEQQVASDLENGFIVCCDEFIPHDQDWT